MVDGSKHPVRTEQTVSGEVVRRRVWTSRLARLTRLPRWVYLLGSLLLLMGASAGYYVYDYTENNPRFCLMCHTMKPAWDQWATSEHRKLNCHACHRQSKLRGLRQLWIYLTKHPEEVGPHGHVPPQICAECHMSNNPRWRQVAATAGHRVHVEREKIPCWKCHAKSIHRFRPPEKSCQECHKKTHITIAPMGKKHCTSCHNYLVAQVSMLPTRNDCLWCHQKELKARIVFDENSPMQFECQNCHNPHKERGQLVACSHCHGPESRNQPQKGSLSSAAILTEKQAAIVQETIHEDCRSCHRPHTWNTKGDSTCLSCHAPLPKVAGHGEGHKILQCADCHLPHRWRTEAKELCQTCHRRFEER